MQRGPGHTTGAPSSSGGGGGSRTRVRKRFCADLYMLSPIFIVSPFGSPTGGIPVGPAAVFVSLPRPATKLGSYPVNATPRPNPTGRIGRDASALISRRMPADSRQFDFSRCLTRPTGPSACHPRFPTPVETGSPPYESVNERRAAARVVSIYDGISGMSRPPGPRVEVAVRLSSRRSQQPLRRRCRPSRPGRSGGRRHRGWPSGRCAPDRTPRSPRAFSRTW
jgi:hypothetical protein